MIAAESANVTLETAETETVVSNVCCRCCCYLGQFRECLHQEGKKKRTMRMSVLALGPPPGPSAKLCKRRGGLHTGSGALYGRAQRRRGCSMGKVTDNVGTTSPCPPVPRPTAPSNGPRRVLAATASGHS